jgi:rod shape-determining protein MreD
MATFLAIPILGILLIFQSAVLTRFPLLHGTADLALLVVIAWALQKQVKTAWQWGIIGGLLVGLVSALPFWASIGIYVGAVMISLALRQRVWQAPILAMFIATFLVTMLAHTVTVVVLRLSGASLPVIQILNLISLPTAVLNLVFAIPAFYLIADLAKWLYPEQLQV